MYQIYPWLHVTAIVLAKGPTVFPNRKGEGVGMSEARSLFPRSDGCCFMDGFCKYILS